MKFGTGGFDLSMKEEKCKNIVDHTQSQAYPTINWAFDKQEIKQGKAHQNDRPKQNKKQGARK